MRKNRQATSIEQTARPEAVNDALDSDQVKIRINQILQGAFMGPPTPLKDIPKKETRVRPEGEPQERRARRQRKNRAA